MRRESRGSAGSRSPQKFACPSRRRCQRRAPCPAEQPSAGHRAFPRGGVGVEPMVIEDVDVVDAKALQALVEAGQKVLARAEVAIRTGPHVPTGFRRDDQLIAVPAKVAAQHSGRNWLRRCRMADRSLLARSKWVMPRSNARRRMERWRSRSDRRRSCAEAQGHRRRGGGRCARSGGSSSMNNGRRWGGSRLARSPVDSRSSASASRRPGWAITKAHLGTVDRG